MRLTEGAEAMRAVRGTVSKAAWALALAAALAGCARPVAAPREAPSAPKPAPVVWPLLGTPAPNAAATRVRVVCAKVENEPPARPQSGLAQADVVYETIIEGGQTRFAALYHSRAPATVGPIRSARVSDTYIVPQYRAVLARIGADFVVEAAIKATPHMDDMNAFTNPGPYTRVGFRHAPHNLYLSIPALRKAAARKYPALLDAPGLSFGPAPPAASATATATVVTIPFSAEARATWTWNRSARSFERTLNGSRAGDAGSSAPYRAANVVVLQAKMVRTRALDPAGNPTFDNVLTGSGEASVFRGGKRYNGVWSAGSDAPPRLVGADGREIRLAPGRTWFEVVRTGTAIPSR